MTPTFVSAPWASTFLAKADTSSRATSSSRPATLFSLARRTTRMVTATPLMSPSLDVAGKPSPVQDAMAAFRTFFASQSGSWNSERTYHYTDDQPGREESATTFDVLSLSDDEVRAVLTANRATEAFDDKTVTSAEGFRVSFLTRMASQEKLVQNSTDLAFVPLEVDGAFVSGLYFRSMGYEERNPVIARFNFDAGMNSLNMITKYSTVTSVDKITLVNPTMRLRNIVNYKRPADGMPLTDPVLVGFGVEKKRSTDTPRTIQ